MDTTAVLSLFDRRMRREAAPGDPGIRVERGERTTIWIGEADGWSAVLWSDLDESTADAEIERVVARFRSLGREFEWKLYAHDRPADLGRRLETAGLHPGEEESVLVADLAELELDAEPPDGLEVRPADSPEAIAAVVELHERVFAEKHASLGRELERALEQEPVTGLGVLCLADGVPVSAARIAFDRDSEFASLWGGCTLPEWRGRGAYRASVAFRGRLARDRGYRYLQVDALPTSRPILKRLGFVALTTTTPYTS